MNWAGFRKAAPEQTRAAEKMFERAGVVLVGTVRKDGSPRISPVEPMLVGGDLYLGMMWRSLKARDLLRDPRCTVHSAIADRMAKHGEFKLHGRARNVRDRKERQRYCQALRKKIGWAPEEPNFHLFAVEVESAVLFRAKGQAREVLLWRGRGRVRKYLQTAEDANPKEAEKERRR